MQHENGNIFFCQLIHVLLIPAIDSKKMRNLLNSRKFQNPQLTVYFTVKDHEKSYRKVSSKVYQAF